MKRLRLLAVAALALALAVTAQARVVVAEGGGTPGTAKNFELVGHEPLFARGMNAALAKFGDHVYVGNRTDGQPKHPRPGILVVDVGNPSSPAVVNEIGPPNAGNVGETTRELRVWPDEELLIVLSFRCSPVIHDCAGNPVTPTFRFFDLADPVNPVLVSEYVPTTKNGQVRVPHEFYLWIDPEDPERALVWASLPTISCDPNRPNMVVYDISAVPAGGAVREVAEGNWNQHYPDGCNAAAYDFNLALHSMTPTVDGTVTHLAYLSGHYLALDTSDVADGVAPGEIVDLNDDLLTDPEDRPTWENPNPGHSAVPFPGRPFALITDEVYGKFTHPSFGCPWGWVRTIAVGGGKHPRIVGEYKLVENTEEFCGSPRDDPATESFTSYASHNPTLLRQLGFVTWHSGGLQAIDLRAPAVPRQAGWFSPAPLAAVATEDPALSRGPNKVVMWSFPIIDDGLIYVVDLRNGLYIVRYTGPQADRVAAIDFLEGNSNLGDAARLDKSARP